MEGVIGLLFLLLFLCIALLPVFILFGVVGLAFKSFWVAILFALKYFLPEGIVGFIVALIRGRSDSYEFSDYMKYIGGFMAVGLAAMFIFVNIPATPVLPKGEETDSVTVSFVYDPNSSETEVNDETNYRIVDICDSLNKAEFKRTFTEFISEEDEKVDITVTFNLKNGEKLTYIFYSDEALAVDNGKFLKYYRVVNDQDLPRDSLIDIIHDAERARNSIPWQPFVEEFFNSIYLDEEGYINFTIPAEAPGESRGIRINLKGDENYTPGEKFEPLELYVFRELQNSGDWEAGATYRFPISTIVYNQFEFVVKPFGCDAFRFNVLPLLPPENVHK